MNEQTSVAAIAAARGAAAAAAMLAMGASLMLWIGTVARADTPAAPALAAGSTWVVDKTTAFQSLIIPEGAKLAAPAGHSLTMTVDGVGTPIQPGSYQGNIVLTVTDDIIVKFDQLEPYRYRAALYIDDGGLVAGKSVAAAVVGGHVGDTAASDVSITSNEEKFNGILVTGTARYTIDHPTIRLTGNGGNDFAGYGAAIMSSGNADVTVNRAHITAQGAIRTAVFVGGHSTMRINDSSIEVFNGTLPADYHFNIDAGKMMEVPWMLGLTGNVRATNLVEHGTVYYNHDHIRAQGWGALSADGPELLRMYVTDSLIETVDSGYGAYAIGNTVDHFSHCTFNVADVGLIIAAAGSADFTDGSVVNSRRFGVMMHSGVGGGTLTIDKGSIFNTRATAIQVKGRGTTIIIDDAAIHARNGIILQAMVNDDPMAPTGPMPGDQAPAGAASVSPAVVATFRNVALKGDVINARTAQGDLNLTLENARITGSITTATAAAATGKVPTAKTYNLIGDVKNTFGPTTDRYGLQLTMDARSVWSVRQTSYLNRLTLADGARISAGKGHAVTLLVNGVRTAIAPGSYTGNVVLQIG
jgi:hypothetical protein